MGGLSELSDGVQLVGEGGWYWNTLDIILCGQIISGELGYHSPVHVTGMPLDVPTQREGPKPYFDCAAD